ncbi:MAG: methyltransferase domain-containing protein [Rubrivivax sp.]
MTASTISSPAPAAMFAAAEAYDRYMGRWSRRLAPLFLAFAGVRDGDRVLDVGSGTGSLALAAADALPASPVLGIDPSASFVDFARRRGTPPRLRFEVGDAQELPCPSSGFDHALALLVLNFVPDHQRAIAEMRRVTRPGGTVGACVWDYGDGMQMLRVFWDAATALDASTAERDERHMKLWRPGQLAAAWAEAGLAEVREETLSIELPFASFDDYWGPFLAGAGPGGAHVARLDPAARDALAARLRRQLLGGRADGAFTLMASARCVRGKVPGGG